jgi:hypothetical protein
MLSMQAFRILCPWLWKEIYRKGYEWEKGEEEEVSCYWMTLKNGRILEIVRGITGSPSVKNSIWKRPWNCHKTDHWVRKWVSERLWTLIPCCLLRLVIWFETVCDRVDSLPLVHDRWLELSLGEWRNNIPDRKDWELANSSFKRMI